MSDMSFGERLRRAIGEKYVSLNAFARAIDMSETQLRRYIRERRPQRPSDELLVRFARGLGESVGELFMWRLEAWGNAPGAGTEGEARGDRDDEESFVIDAAREVYRRAMRDPGLRDTIEEVDRQESEEGRQEARDALVGAWSGNLGLYATGRRRRA